MGRTKRACHLHPILCTWDAVIACTPVTVFFPLGVRLCSKKRAVKTKPQECSYLPTILAFHHEPDKIYSSLTVQLEAAIIEVPTLQALRLRTKLWRLHGPNMLLSTKLTQDLSMAKLTILAWRQSYFIKFENLWFFKMIFIFVLTWHSKWPHACHPDLQLWNLVYSLRKVHWQQTTSTSYKFLVANHVS